MLNNSLHLTWKFGYLSVSIICEQLHVHSRKTVSFEEKKISKDKYPSIFFPLTTQTYNVTSQMRVKRMVIKRWNGRLDIISFSTQASMKLQLSFKFWLILLGLVQSTAQHDKQITVTVIKLPSSGTFARMLILRKPLAFTGKTLKKYVKKNHKILHFHENTF